MNSKKLEAMDAFPFVSGIYMYGENTISSTYPVYCDHHHLYSFFYDTVTPQGNTDLTTDLSVFGKSMVGASPSTCQYVETVSITHPLGEGVIGYTSADSAVMTCGHFVEYEWSGNSDVWFEIHSMNAIAKTVSVFAFVALSALFLWGIKLFKHWLKIPFIFNK